METTELIVKGGSVFLEFLTPLAPAIITALFGYYIAKIQTNVRVKELNINTQYKASEKLFDYNVAQKEKIQNNRDDLQYGILYARIPYRK